MNRFPTWQVWKLLHTYPAREINLLQRVLRVSPHKVMSAPLHYAWVWVILNLIASAALCFNWPRLIGSSLWLNSPILSLFITLDSLYFALKVNTSLSKWREQGNHDVFMLLPAGALAGVLNICRTYRFPIHGTIRGVKSLLFITLLVVSCLLIFDATPGSFGVFSIILFILLAGLMRCVDYVQSFVAAALLVVLANQCQNRHDAQVQVIAGFLGLQIILYVVLIPLLGNVPFPWLGNTVVFSQRIDDIYLWWLVLFAPLIFMLCREIVNFLLWQAVKHRLEA